MLGERGRGKRFRGTDLGVWKNYNSKQVEGTFKIDLVCSKKEKL